MSDFIPKVPPLFQTSLSFPFAPNDATFTIASDLMLNGVPLSGLVCVSIDIGEPNPEYVVGTLLNDVITVIRRNVDPLNPMVAGPMPSQEHRRGATVKITDFATIGIMRNILNGDQPLQNIISYLTHPNFFADTQIIDKLYSDSQAQSGIIIPNGGTPVSGDSGLVQVNTETITVATTGSNRFLYAKFTLESTQTISSMTYNGVPMTLIGAQNQGALRVEVWGLINPTLGSHPLVVNFSGLTFVEWDIIPFDQTDQTTPFVLGSVNGGNSTTSSGSATTVNANSIVIHGIGTKLIGVTYTPGAGEVIVTQDINGSVQGAVQVQTVISPSTVTSNIGISSATDWANVIGVLNGVSTPAKVKVSSTDAVADYLFNKLVAGLNIGLSIITIAGSQKVKITSLGGGGSAGEGVLNLTQTFLFSDFSNDGSGNGVVPFTAALPPDSVPIGVVYEFLSPFDGGSTIETLEANPGNIIGANVAADTSNTYTGETDGNNTSFDFNTNPNPVMFMPGVVPTQGQVKVSILYSAVPKTVIKTYISKPMALVDGTVAQTFYNNNTQMQMALVNIPQSIKISKVSVDVFQVNTPGTINHVIYSEDGQTLLLDQVSGVIAGTGVDTTTLGTPLVIPAGNYYIGSHSNVATDIKLNNIKLINEDITPIGGAVVAGVVTIVASTTPATIDPTVDIVFDILACIVTRLDS